ncbi:DNA polymerase Y family protein [Microbacterium sp. 5K110]|jgi:protein ImuB|uniref:DNA polymerase Y family protein n=1 Tax=unclassified Microbacterium TaxID=2609290 RepID=UPI0010FECC4F|nr:DNA polymerase Y family protein [Microbacterium sp. 5K110]TLF33710.1 DNA polymerase Y family protein [Microbacterium sp. 5K110]
MREPTRSLVMWLPDWPVLAYRREAARPPRADTPVAVFENNTVVACSAAARAQGVRRGQRRRDAQALCPSLVVIAADPVRDARVFAPVVALIEERAPGVQIVRPGLCALRARGPARYYGGEDEAARTLVRLLVAEGFTDARASVADGVFTAEHAARVTRADEPVRVVPGGQAAAFLAPLPVTALEDPDLASLLARLGVHTLGEFAAMPVERVRERFAERGARLHALASGRDSQPVQPRTPPPELRREVAFEPPLELADQIAFGMRVAAEEFIARLGEQNLVCTEVRVVLSGERGERSERVWLHPGSFDAGAVVDRVRWQLAEDGRGIFGSGVAGVSIEPEAVDEASHHVKGLFGAGPDERVHHAFSRVQAMLGHRAVVTPVVGGGRWLAERQVLVPWGDRAVTAKDRARPWPGSLPDPLPATVYPEPRLVEVTDVAGASVTVGDRDALSAPPAILDAGGRRMRIREWAGPWPISERGWDPLRRRRAHRFQVVDDDGGAWLLVVEEGEWRAEGRYD